MDKNLQRFQIHLIYMWDSKVRQMLSKTAVNIKGMLTAIPLHFPVKLSKYTAANGWKHDTFLLQYSGPSTAINGKRGVKIKIKPQQ